MFIFIIFVEWYLRLNIIFGFRIGVGYCFIIIKKVYNCLFFVYLSCFNNRVISYL